MLSNMFRDSASPPMSLDKHFEDIGIVPMKKKIKINKESEVDKANKTMNMFLTKEAW